MKCGGAVAAERGQKQLLPGDTHHVSLPQPGRGNEALGETHLGWGLWEGAAGSGRQ